MKKFNFLKKPNLIFQIIIYLLFILFLILSIIYKDDTLKSYIFFSFLGITFFYSLYLFIINFSHYKTFFKKLWYKLVKNSKFLTRFSSDYNFRTLVIAIGSITFTLIYATYNLVVGYIYKSIWNISLFYYLFVVVSIKLALIIVEIRTRVKLKTHEERILKRSKMYLVSSYLSLVLDFVMLAPIILMILFEKNVRFPAIIAIINAFYVFLKVTFSFINLYKTRKTTNYSIKSIRRINAVDAQVSLISLAYTLMVVFGSGEDDLIKPMITILGAISIIYASILSILNIIDSHHKLKENKEEYNKIKENIENI